MKILVSIIIVFSFFPLLTSHALAQNQMGPNTFGNDANTINLGNQLQNRNLGLSAPAQGGMIGTIIRNVLFLFFAIGGLGAVIYFVWGAVDWILSGGDKEKVSNARKKMTQAIIGLVLLALSFFIIQVVGEIIGFNPLGTIQIRSLEEP